MVMDRTLSVLLDRDTATAAKRAECLRLPPLALLFAHKSKRRPMPVAAEKKLLVRIKRPEPGGRARFRATGKPVERVNASAGHRDTRKGQKPKSMAGRPSRRTR